MSVVSQNIEELEGSVERAQVVLDQVRRALTPRNRPSSTPPARPGCSDGPGSSPSGCRGRRRDPVGPGQGLNTARPMTEQGIAERASSRTVSASVQRLPMG
jgi:hypothetical protein